MPSSHLVSVRLGMLSLRELEKLVLSRPWTMGRQHDLHDVADTLLSPESIVPTLRSLARPTLMSLISGTADALAREVMLADDDGAVYPEVTALVPAILDQSVPAAPATSGDSTTVALHSVIAIRDLIDWVARDPIPMGATGGLLKVEEKMLAAGLVVSDEDAAALVGIAHTAGLVNTIDRRLYATTRGLELMDNLIGLWTVCAESIGSIVSRSVREACAAASRYDLEFIEWLMPFRDSSESRELTTLSNGSRLFGLTAGGTTELGRAFLDPSADATAQLSDLFPELQNSVYVLDDLSIIAPGPVSRATADFLSLVSTLETRGLAPKYRLDQSLILRAIANGQTADSIVARLMELSLTPVSPAVTSTVDDTSRNGRFIVLNGTGTDTAAKASHAELGEMLLTDPRLQRLAPIKVDDFSVLYGASRLRVETALAETRYTVVSPTPEIIVVAPAAPTKLLDLIEHLHETGLGSTHLERALMTAGKSRSSVTLLVETSTGNRTITLEPRHVANGRVRGLDTVADVERTLPISAIIELLAVGE
ncbi:MAG: helicase-associated domain-containing protein [Microbacteriaceae bacterium]|nr:helicase-associated domain-containing protein [Microbacteriaceae bacterium]